MIQPSIFWTRVDKSGECWIWTGALTNNGYGRHSGTVAHRVSYELANGPIPEGMTVDHACFRRSCVNPAHLRLMSHLENSQRQRKGLAEQCPRGHAYSGSNLIQREGRRRCRAYENAAQRRRYRARVGGEDS